MQNQFSRMELMFGRNAAEILGKCRVAVFGLGGVGGQCAETLARGGIGTLDLFDGDTVSVTNINRQIIATHKTLGRDKVDVMRERILDINPAARVNAYKLFYLPENADTVDLSVYHYIADAVDTISAKAELAVRAQALGIPLISAMGAANRLDPTAFEATDIYATSVCPVARVMRRELKKRGVRSLKVVYSKEMPLKPLYADGENADCAGTEVRQGKTALASTPFVPPAAGLILAGEVIKDLLRQGKL